MSRRYQGLGFEGRAAVLQTLAHGDEAQIVDAILGAAEGSEEPDWVESAALALTWASDDRLQRVGLLALGILVRRFSGRADLAAVTGAAQRFESESRLSGTASDLLDDIEVFGEDRQPLGINEPEA